VTVARSWNQRPVLIVAVFLSLSLTLDWIRFMLDRQDMWGPLDLSCGLATGLILLCGARFAPSLFLAVALSLWWFQSHALFTLPVILFLGLAYTLSFGLVFGVVRRMSGGSLDLRRIRDTLMLVVGTTFAPLVVGLLVASFSELNVHSKIYGRFLDSLTKSWSLEAAGILTLTPFLLVYLPRLPFLRLDQRWGRRGSPASAPPSRPRSGAGSTAERPFDLRSAYRRLASYRGDKLSEPPALRWDLLLLYTLSAGICFAAAGYAKIVYDIHLFYICLLPLVWPAVRHGVAFTAALLLSANSLVVLIWGLGGWGAILPASDFRVLLIASSTGALILGALVTEMKQTQAELIESGNRLQAIFEAEPEAVSLLDLSGRLLAANLAALAALEAEPPESIRGRFLEEFASPESRDSLERVIARASQGETGVLDFEIRGLRNGRRWLETHAIPLRAPDHTVEGVLCICRDISARMQAAAELAASEEKFARAFHLSPDSISIATVAEGRFLEVNAGFCSMVGYSREEVLGLTSTGMGFWADPAERSRIVARVDEQGRVDNALMHFRHKSGAIRLGLFSAEALNLGPERCWLVTIRDITDKQRLEEQFLQAQKMEAVGRLAGGVAHDFSNLLTVIQGHASVMLEQLPEDTSAARGMTEVVKATKKAASLVGQLLSFSQDEIFQLKAVALGEVIADMAKMIGRLTGGGIELNLSLAPHVSAIRADVSSLQQVIMNLVVNARDAMPNGGKLQLEICNFHVDERFARARFRLPLGNYVRLSVRDTGNGIDESLQARIFEPFFTTKDAGKGTGLGLATVYGIVQRSGGHVWVESVPGRGSAFHILFPADAHVAEPMNAPTASLAVPSGNETVLLVEDEPSVRDFTESCLKRLGYSVLSAGTGREALELAEQNRPQILVTDVVMPRMNGRELAARVQARWPEVKVLFISGYHGDIVLDRNMGNAALLQKPFFPEDLARMVRQVLDDAPQLSRTEG
jgi:two-component system cell cycle sensor histidine kinase/response regulator CckA